MKLEVKNLGIIKQAEIDLSKNLLIFTGYNNTGKTYLTYLLYGFYKLFNKLKDESRKFDFVEKNKDFFDLFTVKNNSTEKDWDFEVSLNFYQEWDKILSIFQNKLVEYCNEIFVDNEIRPNLKIIFSEDEKNDIFKIKSNYISENQSNSIKNGILEYKQNHKNVVNIFESELSINQIKLKLFHYFFEYVFDIYLTIKEIRFFPAERSALNQYAYDIIYTRAEKYEEAQNQIFSENKTAKHEIPEYPLAINDYIKLVYNLRKWRKNTTQFDEMASKIETMLGGKVSIDEDGNINFLAFQTQQSLKAHLTSSTVKSLAVLVLYLRHVANFGDIIFIDEPEINLHPENQRKLARIIAELSNLGLKLIVSTHSDYFTKELASLIMLSKNFENKNELLNEFELTENELIKKETISIYSSSRDGQITEEKINGFGIEVEYFDSVIDNQSQMYDKIYFMTSDDE